MATSERPTRSGDAERVANAVVELLGRRSKFEVLNERRGELVRVIAREMNAIIGEWIDRDAKKIAEQCAEIDRLHSPAHMREVANAIDAAFHKWRAGGFDGRNCKDVIYDALTDAMAGK